VALTAEDFLDEWGDTVPFGAFRFRRHLVGVVVIPARFRKIEGSAFFGCSGLTEVRLPDTLTEIGQSAFSGCSGLTKLRLPETLTVIEEGAFGGCSGLTELRLPDSLTKIGGYAFCVCSGLTELRLPGSIESLGGGAFSRCTSLRLVAMHSVAQLGLNRRGDSHQFHGCTSLAAVSAPAEVASRFPADMFEGCSAAPSALLAAATADLGLWYYWSRQSHLRCLLAAKQTVLAVMLVGLRLDRDSDSQLPALPSEIWCCVLERMCRHELAAVL